jgi:hypothetical protein
MDSQNLRHRSGRQGPLAALEKIESATKNHCSLFILKDFHEVWSNPIIKRKLRSPEPKTQIHTQINPHSPPPQAQSLMNSRTKVCR